MRPAFLEAVDDVCAGLVEGRIAPVVAAGCARRTTSGWERHTGGATERIFDLASLTKPMTAFAVERSRLSKDALLGDVLEEASASVSASASIELLLAHRAGLEAHLPLFAPLVSGGTVERSVALRRVASARRSDASGELPREGFAPLYSDLGYILVGEALARREGAIDAGEVIERLVAKEQELGTARSLRARAIEFDARVVPTELVDWRGGEVRGAVHDENAWALTRDGGSGHAGMFGTVDAVLDFACEAHDHATEWMVRERPGGTLRAGFDGKSEEGSSAGTKMGPRTFGHLGFTGTSLWIDPEANVVVVLLTNRVHPTRENLAIRAARPIAHDALFLAARGESSGGKAAPLRF